MLTTDALVSDFFQRWDKADNKLIQLIEQMPEDKLDFKPMDKSFTFRDIILHIYQGEQVLSGAVLKGELLLSDFLDYIFPDCKTKEDLIRHAREIHSFTNDKIACMSVEELSKIVKSQWGDKPAYFMLFSAYDHLLHHRGQVYFYLRQAGVENPVPVDE